MIFIVVFILFIVLFDQTTKFFALTLQTVDFQRFLPGILRFRYHENEGAAWGILADHRWVFMTVSVIAILVMIAILIQMRKERDWLLFSSLAMFIGGGIGNMIDRIFRGYVIDFLEFEFIDFPIFNVADSFVTIGAVFMVAYLVRETVREVKQKKARKENESTPK